MTNSPEVVAERPPASPLEAFNGTIVPSKIGLLYRAGLAVVAFAMVLLPLTYIGLIVVTAWLVVLHLVRNTWIFNDMSGRGGLVQVILYGGPALVGGILVFFMVKPFFAARSKEPDSIVLDPAKESLLFAFVEKICRLVGAPVPSRIDVDCQVNASASLRRGLLSKDLVLTIGLPLASGLDMRQFAGVLAHEFGHFAQGAGLRLTYVIRKINFWFARVVYERDAWDVKLEQTAKGIDLRLGIVLHAARGCVWLTRRILWALMHAGHAISCFMLRQMEYDADSYEAKLAGSDAFESTSARMRVLNVASQFAYEDVGQSWTSNRLPENLPLLIGHKAGSLPAEVHQKLSASEESARTRWFDTHPCDPDRIKAARQLNQPGIFRLTEPATGLFADFAEISRQVTRHQYEMHMELEFTDQNLMSAEEILRESTASAEADSMVRRYYGDVNLSLKPLLIDGGLPPLEDLQGAIAKWREARQLIEELRTSAAGFSVECLNQQARLIEAISAQQLAKAGFKVEPGDFGLPPKATSPGDQEIAARFIINEASAAITDQLAKLEPFTAALRKRVTLALRAGQDSARESNPSAADEAATLARLLAAVGAEMVRAHEIASKIPAFTLLAQNGGDFSQLAAELQTLTGGIQERLQPFAYPFPHARGPLSVAEYARSEKPAENDGHRTYLEASAHVDRLFALHYRLLGRVLALADAAEKMFETASPEAQESRAIKID